MVALVRRQRRDNVDIIARKNEDSKAESQRKSSGILAFEFISVSETTVQHRSAYGAPLLITVLTGANNCVT